MELNEKRKRAAVIAATIYVQMEENKDKVVSPYGWSKSGMIRRMNDRDMLIRKGRAIGGRIY